MELLSFKKRVGLFQSFGAVFAADAARTPNAFLLVFWSTLGVSGDTGWLSEGAGLLGDGLLGDGLLDGAVPVLGGTLGLQPKMCDSPTTSVSLACWVM